MALREPQGPPPRPSLVRANASSQSLPTVDSTDVGKRRPSMTPAKMAALNAASASANSSPMVTPLALSNQNRQHSYFEFGNGEMLRSESNDSHRSLKGKSSRKELRELARSATPTANQSAKSSAKQAKHSAYEDDEDDSRSIDSFACSFSSEFDRQNRAHAVAKGEKHHSRQNWLDATFRRLSQKNGVRRHAPHLKMPPMPTITDADGLHPSANRKLSSASAHFLDFSDIISPIPRPGVDMLQPPPAASTNVTPRPEDFQRFPHPPPLPSPRSMDENDAHLLDQNASQQTLRTLRTRRSEDSLTVRRRLQRQQGPSGDSSTALTPSLMIDMARKPNNPVPRLPEWARSENRALRPIPLTSGCPMAASARMARTVSHDVSEQESSMRRPSAPASMDMQRAVSHDPSALHLSFGPSLLSNFEQWHAQDDVAVANGQERPFSPTDSTGHSNGRSQSALDHVPSRHALPPLSPCDMISPQSRTMALPHSSHGLNRGSVSSAASDSDISSSISSVPQTPISRINILPGVSGNGMNGAAVARRESESVHSVYYDMDPMMTENDLAGASAHLASLGSRYAEHGKEPPTKLHGQQYHPPPTAYFMSSHAVPRNGQHVANIFAGSDQHGFDGQSRHTPSSSVCSVTSSNGAHATLRASQAPTGRPRAATTASAPRPSLQAMRPAAAQQSVENLAQTIDRGASSSSSTSMTRKLSAGSFSGRKTSLSHSRSGSGEEKRTSVASNTSNGTSSSSGASSNSSGASALLSYMRGFSKSQSNLASLPESSSKGSSSSAGTIHAAHSPSPTKQRTMTAEQVASSIGRKFGRGIAAASRS